MNFQKNGNYNFNNIKVDIDFDHDEIILATYGYYSEGGRYTYLRAYSPSGHYLRNMSEKEAE